MEMPNNRLQKLLGMLEQQPDDLFLKYALGMEFLGMNDTDKAEQAFREVINADEHYVPAYYQLGRMLESAKKETEAMAIFEKGLTEARLKKDRKTIQEFQSALDQLQFLDRP